MFDTHELFPSTELHRTHFDEGFSSNSQRNFRVPKDLLREELDGADGYPEQGSIRIQKSNSRNNVAMNTVRAEGRNEFTD